MKLQELILSKLETITEDEEIFLSVILTDEFKKKPSLAIYIECNDNTTGLRINRYNGQFMGIFVKPSKIESVIQFLKEEGFSIYPSKSNAFYVFLNDFYMNVKR